MVDVPHLQCKRRQRSRRSAQKLPYRDRYRANLEMEAAWLAAALAGVAAILIQDRKRRRRTRNHAGLGLFDVDAMDGQQLSGRDIQVGLGADVVALGGD